MKTSCPGLLLKTFNGTPKNENVNMLFAVVVENKYKLITHLLLFINKYLTGISATRIWFAVPPDAINLNPKS